MVRVKGVEKDLCYSVVGENMAEDPQVGLRDPDALCVSRCSKSVGSKELIVGLAQHRVRSCHRGLDLVRWETGLGETSSGGRRLSPFNLRDCEAHMGGPVENRGSGTAGGDWEVSGREVGIVWNHPDKPISSRFFPLFSVFGPNETRGGIVACFWRVDAIRGPHVGYFLDSF